MIAEMVRFNCRTYPSSTAESYFLEPPYGLTSEELNTALEALSQRLEYADIARVYAKNGEPYLYSRQYFTDRYGQVMADYAADETT